MSLTSTQGSVSLPEFMTEYNLSSFSTASWKERNLRIVYSRGMVLDTVEKQLSWSDHSKPDVPHEHNIGFGSTLHRSKFLTKTYTYG